MKVRSYFKSERVPRTRDLLTICLVWLTVRTFLVFFQYRPLIEEDSLTYPSFFVALENPHHPLLYGIFLSLFPPTLVIVLQHLMVLASSYALYEVGRESASRMAGLISALFVVTYGDFVIKAHSFMSETLFNFFLSFHLIALWLAISKNSPTWYFRSGLVIGLAANVRAVAQYQTAVVALSLLPFYVRSLRGLRQYVYSFASMLIGFLVIVLPIATIVRLNYGEFKLTAGLEKVMVERLPSDPDSPLTKVRLKDPTLMQIRDCLVESKALPGDAYPYIKREILKAPDSQDKELNSYIRKLWWEYIKEYPVECIWFSLRGLRFCLVNHSTFAGSQAYSNRVLEEFPSNKFSSVCSPPERKSGGIRLLDSIHITVAGVIVGPLAVGLVVILGIISLKSMPRIMRRYMIVMYCTAFYLIVPNFFVSVPVLRYRYPLDLMYALFLGIASDTLLNRWRKRRTQ